MKRLTSCFCCCSPRTGAIVLASLGIVIFGPYLIANIYYSVRTDGLIKHWKKQLKEVKDEKESLDKDSYDAYVFTLNLCINYVPTIIGLSYLRCFYYAIINPLLIYGILKKRHKFVLPWTICGSIWLIIDTLMVVAFFIYCMVIGSYGYGSVLLIIGALNLLLTFYFLQVVHTAYKEIRDEGGKAQNLS